MDLGVIEEDTPSPCHSHQEELVNGRNAIGSHDMKYPD